MRNRSLRIVLGQRVLSTLSIAFDVAVIVAIVFVRWRGHTVGAPDPDLPGVAQLPSWWWSIGSIADWLLYPGADAGLWAMNIDLWREGGMLDIHRPPLFTILTGVATPLFGDLVIAGHMVNHALSLLVCVGVYALGRSTSGRGAAMGAALLTACSPNLIGSQAEFGVDPSLQFGLMLLALTSWWAANGGWWRVFLAGGAAGVAAGAHFLAFAFVVPITLLLMLADRPGSPWWHRIAAPALVLAVAFPLWGSMMHRYPEKSPARILSLYTDPISGYRAPASVTDDGMTTANSAGILLSGLRERPLVPVTRALQPFVSMSIPWQPLLVLGLVGILGPGLRQTRRSSFRWDWVPNRSALKIKPNYVELRWGLGLHRTSRRGWDWRPALWLVMFLLPLVALAAANAPDRYTLYSQPLVYLALTRGLASLGAGVDRLVAPKIPSWPRGVVAFVACAGFIGWIAPGMVRSWNSVDIVDHGLLHRIAGKAIRRGFGDSGCIVTLTPEICYFGGGHACPSGQCDETDRGGLQHCVARLMFHSRCMGDLAYVQEPGKDWGPFLQPSERIEELVRTHFEVEETVSQGQHTAIIYRMDREILEELAGEELYRHWKPWKAPKGPLR